MKINTKMPELDDVEDEEVELSDRGVRDRDTQIKQSNKDYLSRRFYARDCEVKEGDTVLLEKKENKLSPSCAPNKAYTFKRLWLYYTTRTTLEVIFIPVDARIWCRTGGGGKTHRGEGGRDLALVDRHLQVN